MGLLSLIISLQNSGVPVGLGPLRLNQLGLGRTGKIGSSWPSQTACIYTVSYHDLKKRKEKRNVVSVLLKYLAKGKVMIIKANNSCLSLKYVPTFLTKLTPIENDMDTWLGGQNIYLHFFFFFFALW